MTSISVYDCERSHNGLILARYPGFTKVNQRYWCAGRWDHYYAAQP